ncbi:pectinesterase [Byssothecium circinans]|uniref:pectinesterase n=1 Tax=Byssothecium circinans TaxID=147558 RepID=A0A6A5TZY9_9PLEO|nr:pectinesterase [Byssothecium circinans]
MLRTITLISGFLLLAECTQLKHRASGVGLVPSNGTKNVNVDTHLVITLPSSPTIGSVGNITVRDDEDGRIIDILNLAIPSSPSPFGNGSTKANYTDKTTYQTNIIGGLDFYFFPIIVTENTATIYLHNNRLEYDRTYSVTVDPGVLSMSNGSFDGIASDSWTFTTKTKGPVAGQQSVTVCASGTEDFSTLQGALDWAPSNSRAPTTIHIRSGTYTELIYFQYKSNLIIRGSSRNSTSIRYPNNSAFNPPNRQGASRRPAFSFKGVSDIQLADFSITNLYRGQAEALLIDGTRVTLSNMQLHGSGDALTTYGTAYITDTILIGDGDTILGYGAVFWNRSTIITTAGPVSWTRTPQGVHGNVLLDCVIRSESRDSTLARLPDNTGGVAPNWPYAEMILINCTTDGISTIGWGPVQGPPLFNARNVKFWEYGTVDTEGKAVDYSKRLNVSRQLTLPTDEEVVRQYSNPAFVLGGWTPGIL